MKNLFLIMIFTTLLIFQVNAQVHSPYEESIDQDLSYTIDGDNESEREVASDEEGESDRDVASDEDQSKNQIKYWEY